MGVVPLDGLAGCREVVGTDVEGEAAEVAEVNSVVVVEAVELVEEVGAADPGGGTVW
jgi:hypothetical protein